MRHTHTHTHTHTHSHTHVVMYLDALLLQTEITGVVDGLGQCCGILDAGQDEVGGTAAVTRNLGHVDTNVEHVAARAHVAAHAASAGPTTGDGLIQHDGFTEHALKQHAQKAGDPPKKSVSTDRRPTHPPTHPHTHTPTHTHTHTRICESVSTNKPCTMQVGQQRLWVHMGEQHSAGAAFWMTARSK
jgi:hypothetical protein